jgi:hypothetical protein
MEEQPLLSISENISIFYAAGNGVPAGVFSAIYKECIA